LGPAVFACAASFARVALVPQGKWEARALPGAVCRSLWDQR